MYTCMYWLNLYISRSFTIQLNMKSLLQYFLSAFLLNQLSTAYAAYSPTNSSYESCPLGGLGVKTCRGVGTTDIADLMYQVLEDKESYAIIGEYEGLYVVVSVAYKLSPGVDAFLVLSSILAYVLEYPCPGGGHTYYLVTVTGCPSITIITGCSKGVIPSTTLSYATIYNAIQPAREPYNLPCNVLLGPDLRQPRYTSFYNLDVNTPVTFSDLISFQYYPFNKKYSQAPYYAAVKYGLDVQVVNGTSYVQSGYLNGAKPCYKPDDVPPHARALADAGFDFKKVMEQKNGLCLLSTALSTFGATAKYPYYLYFQKIFLLTKPYNFVAVCAGYIQTDLGNIMYGPIGQLC